MKLVYFVHSKNSKHRHCNAIIGKEDSNIYHTIHLKNSQKGKKTIEFKPAFSGYELDMVKRPMIDKWISQKYLEFLNKKEEVKEDA